MAAASSSDPPPPCGLRHTLKLCINSHVAYHVPLLLLFRSLLNVSGFERFGDVLVLQGGAANDEPPRTVRLAELVPELTVPHEVVIVRTRVNAFDYHGLSLLYKYRAHPLVRAETYVYCHDTTTFDPGSFLERFEAFRLPSSPNLFTTWPLPNSNTVAFGAAVVHRYRNNFDGSLASKTQAFPMEFGYSLEARSAEGTAMRPLVAFGFIVKMGPRLPQGTVDVYATGTPRIRFSYPAFGLFKHSMRSDAAGDIVGKRTTLFAGGRRYFPPGNASKLPTILFAQRPSCWDRCRQRAVPLGGKVPLMLPACTPALWR